MKNNMNKIMNRNMQQEGAPLPEESVDNYINITTQNSNTYTIFLDGEILSPGHYRDAIHLLNIASPNDEVVFRISSYGGDLSAGVMLANAIRGTEAHTTAIIETYACSAASLIPMVVDDVITKSHSYMMIHSVVYGVLDDVQKVNSYITFQHERLKALMLDFYGGFLSDKEIDDVVMHSKEIWLTDEQVMERLNNKNEPLGEEEQASLDEIMNQIDAYYKAIDENIDGEEDEG